MLEVATSRFAIPQLPISNGRAPSPKIRSAVPSRSDSRSARLRRPSTATSSYSILTPAETASRLRTSLTRGLSPSDIVNRLHVYGPNELPHEEQEPLWRRFLQQFKETLILLLLGSAAISFLMGNYDDAISIAVAVTIVVSVGFVQEYRSEKSLEALNELVPHFAHVIRADGSMAPARAGGTRPGEPKRNPESPLELHDTIESLEAAEATATALPASQLVPGDLILFHTGDRIPADIRITHSADLSIDESNLTGENEPVSKSPTTLARRGSSVPTRDPSPIDGSIYASPAAGTVGADIRLNDQTNIAFMGTLVRSGHGSGIVIATGGATEFGAISASLQEIESPRTPLQLSMDRLGKELSYLSFAVIAFIMLLGMLRGWEFLEMFTIGVSLAVAAIPEGLPIIVTVTLALGVLRMSKRGAIVRRLPSVETLGSVNVVCSDKTGTLTTNHMTVTKIWHFIPGTPSEPVSISSKQQSLSTSDLDFATRTILRIGNIVNNARLMSGSSSTPASAASAAILSSSANDIASAKSRWVGQPTDVALLDLLDAFGEADVRERIGPRRDETPFSSERKWMGCVIHPGPDNPSGFDVAYAKGAVEQVLQRCDTYITADGKEVELDDARREEAIKAAESMAREGLRVLGFASGALKGAWKLSPSSAHRSNHSGRSSPLSEISERPPPSHSDESLYKGLAFAGLVGMNDPPRPRVDRAIRRLLAGGVRVIMITGDAEHTAVAIARKLGIPVNLHSAIGPSVLRGDQLDRMSEQELSHAIGTTTIFARTSPDHKMKIVRALQARGDVVAMTGDGVNDAPALKKADIGVSMGRLGTDVAKEAADMILTDDDFSTILHAIEEGKGIFYNIQNFLTFQLSTSAAALGLVMVSTVAGFKNPLNAMQILWINILMDGPPAQSLGVEPVDPAVMKLPPRSKHARVLTTPLLRRVLQSSLIIMLGTLSTYILELADGNVVTARDTTMTFTCFVLFDMFNALTCRSEAKSVLRGELPLVGKGSNKMFNYAVAGSLLGQCAVIYFPPLQGIFQTEAIGIVDWIRLLAVASLVFWADEARKALRRWKASRRTVGGYSLNV